MFTRNFSQTCNFVTQAVYENFHAKIRYTMPHTLKQLQSQHENYLEKIEDFKRAVKEIGSERIGNNHV